ncbi:MAG: hypothetical protein MJK18_11000 [Bdellovibrionales bacterium]|nr:hypothetical protein [Bdellovibrionales bacterium]
MKMLMTIISIITCTMMVSSAQANEEAFAGFGNWSAFKVENHSYTEKPSCYATVSADQGQVGLEIYAESHKSGDYIDPVIQIVTRGISEAVGVRLGISNTSYNTKLNKPQISGGDRRYLMTILSSEDNEVQASEDVNSEVIKQQVFVSKNSKISEIVRLLRARNSVVAEFYDSKGERVHVAVFSLSGSSNTIREMLGNNNFVGGQCSN